MTPYLSIVMGIGGNMTDDLLIRFNNSTRLTAMHLKKYRLEAEFVVCEWNIPRSNWNRHAFDFGVPIRIIHAPQSLHDQAFNPHGFKYFEWYPKNIGIRRAWGEFVLSTNPDDLWSEGLAEYLAKRELQHGHFYRVNRHDTQDGKVFRICYPTGAKSPDSTTEQIKQNAPRACPWSENMLHYNASGDFTLMAKDDWFLIHGNPEREYNDSIDGQTLWLAHQKGLKQVVLPYPIYHPDHPRTLNLMNGVQPFDSKWDDNKPHAQENGDDWGFAGMEFEETIL